MGCIFLGEIVEIKCPCRWHTTGCFYSAGFLRDLEIKKEWVSLIGSTFLTLSAWRTQGSLYNSVALSPESQGWNTDWLIVPKVTETCCEQFKIRVGSRVRGPLGSWQPFVTEQVCGYVITTLRWQGQLSGRDLVIRGEGVDVPDSGH